VAKPATPTTKSSDSTSSAVTKIRVNNPSCSGIEKHAAAPMANTIAAERHADTHLGALGKMVCTAPISFMAFIA